MLQVQSQCRPSFREGQPKENPVRNMKVMMLAEVSMASVIGGAERVLREQAIGLTQRGHAVCAIVRSPHDSSPLRVVVDDVVEYRYQPCRRNIVTFVISTIIKSLNCFKSEAKDETPDVVIIHQSLAGLGPILWHRSLAKRWVYVCHSLAHEEYLSRQVSQSTPGLLDRLHMNARRWIEKYVMQRCHQVVVLSDFMKQRVQRVHGISEKIIYIIPGGADLIRFCPAADRARVRQELTLPLHATILCTVRNLVPRMGLETLIHAISRLDRQFNDVLLIMGGEGPLRNRLQHVITNLGLTHRVQLVGFIAEPDLPKYYQAADLVVMPTQELEGFGLVTVEALACGTPVLGTPIGAIPEILSQIDRKLIAKGTEAENLADALNDLLHQFVRDPGYWKELSQRSFHTVEAQYTWQSHATKIEWVFHQSAKEEQAA